MNYLSQKEEREVLVQPVKNKSYAKSVIVRFLDWVNDFMQVY